jgi:hypothetical protein
MITISAYAVRYMHEVLCVISGNPQLPSPVHGWVKTLIEAPEEQARRQIEEREERARNYVPGQPGADVRQPLPILPEGMSPGDTTFPEWFYTDQHRRAIWIGKAMTFHAVRLIDIKYHSKLTTDQIHQDLDYLIGCMLTAYPKETSKVYLTRRRKGSATLYRIHFNGRVIYSGNYASGILERFAEAFTKQRLSPRRYFELK